MIVREHLNAAVPQLLERLPEPEIQEKVKEARTKDELRFVVAFHDLPTFSGIRSLQTDMLGKLITISGTVTRATEVKPELLVGTFLCNDCNREVTGVQQQFKYTAPALCPIKNCGNRTNWTLLAESKTTRFGDWQRVRLQEGENEVPAGAMPRSIDVIVRDEMTERCKPGDKVLLTGCLLVVPDVPSLMSPSELKQQVRRSLNTRSDAAYGTGEGVRGLKGLGNRDLTYKLAFYGGCVEENSDWGAGGGEGSEDIRSDEKVTLSQADKDKFQMITVKKQDCFDVVARCVAPNIHGHLEVKKGILLMLVGALPKRTDEGIRLRGDINVCLLGDPATAKSAMLKWTSMFLPRAVFASGKTSTAAGLTASITRDMDLDQEKVIQPGALMLADNGICCIDEFERMDPKDQVAIHEAMEQQTITLNKAGVRATLNARASILASCLPRDTYYDPTQPLHKNCELTPPIMSRFDLMFVMQDIHDETSDNNVATHILNLHRRGETPETQPLLSQLELQRFIRLARSLKPKVSPEAHEKLIKCYMKLREDRTYVRGACGVTVRQLESLIRLSEAIARVHLSDKITVTHVNMAFELQLNTLKRAERENIDLEAPEGGPEPPADGAAEAAEGAAGEGGEAPARAAAPRLAKRVKITYAMYQKIGHMLTRHLFEKEEANEEVTEEDLIGWYMEQVEDDITTDAQLQETQYLVQLIITRLIEKDRVVMVARASDDPLRPERRVLLKHPNFPVGEVIAG
eukprot:SRR837773.6227.p1 GENE.SRR837773.6227~~SRR837773.6227.p1  ORF type:complete len:818 (+),score=342.94 SRR837773.6227:220-2454(+)